MSLERKAGNPYWKHSKNRPFHLKLCLTKVIRNANSSEQFQIAGFLFGKAARPSAASHTSCVCPGAAPVPCARQEEQSPGHLCFPGTLLAHLAASSRARDTGTGREALQRALCCPQTLQNQLGWHPRVPLSPSCCSDHSQVEMVCQSPLQLLWAQTPPGVPLDISSPGNPAQSLLRQRAQGRELLLAPRDGGEVWVATTAALL